MSRPGDCGTKVGESEETSMGRESDEERKRLQSTLCDLDETCFFDLLLDFCSDFSTVSPLPNSFLSVLCPGDIGVCLTPGYVA